MKQFLRHFIASLIMLFTLASLSTAQISFTKRTIDDNFIGAAGVYACDVNNDGNLDVLGAGVNNGFAVWLNSGAIPVNWSKQVIDETINGAIYVHAIDVDGDLDVDVLGAAWDDNEIAYWRNDGGEPIVWTKQIIDNSFLGAHEVFGCDLDNDGDGDVLGASANGNDIAWWRNDGGDPINWTKQNIDEYFNGARSVYAVDIDGDHDKDVLGASLLGNEITLWRNDGGEPIVWTEITIAANFIGAHKVVACDIDLDGDPDILGAAYMGAEIAWWRNDGGDPIVWSKQTIDNNFRGALTTYATDIDDDGDIDVVGAGDIDDDIKLYRNNGGNPIVWSEYIIDNNYDGAWPVFACDLDGDGDNDVLAGADTDNEITWWENNLYEFRLDANPKTGHAPLTTQFSELSNIKPLPDSWAWDFDNNGSIDSEEQNPGWTFNEPGIYSVSVEITTPILSRTLIFKDFIHVFDGKSALLFDGENSYASCPASAGLNLTAKFTIEAWINPAGWGESVGYGKIIDKNSLSVYVMKKHPFYNDSSLVLKLVHTDGTISRSITPKNSIVIDEWQHIAVTYDADSTVKMYINGIEQEVAQRTKPVGSITDNSEDGLLIGNSPDLNVTFDGIIDEVRIWDVIRTEEEIETALNSCLNGSESGLAAYWQMDEGSGETIFDKSGNGNDASAIATEWREGAPLKQSTTVDKNTSQSIIPSKYKLYTNYPNPFNPRTTIEYQLPVSEEITITVYNAVGQKVRDLFSGNQNAGTHTLDFIGTGLPSGIYFYELKSKRMSLRNKCLLLR